METLKKPLVLRVIESVFYELKELEGLVRVGRDLIGHLIQSPVYSRKSSVFSLLFPLGTN